MDKKVMGLAQKIMGDGEKKAPVKSLKVKVKFQDVKDDDKYEAKKKEMAKKHK